MVFTEAQMQSFFEDEYQMAILNDTVLQLQTEVISNVDDFADFQEENFAQVAMNISAHPEEFKSLPLGPSCKRDFWQLLIFCNSMEPLAVILQWAT